ncbi:MAG: FHA domain-containing protein [Lachnospiraceae bacterium]|nr:FHA domain-containing protein [Lachnospiraceae bacterium]
MGSPIRCFIQGLFIDLNILIHIMMKEVEYRMSITRCSKGLHFYDDTKYDECPHCGVKAKNVNTSVNELNEMVTMAQYNFDDMDMENPMVNNHFMENSIQRQFVNMDFDNDGRTVAYYSSLKGNDFVTGWLVCVSGPEKGRDYRLHHGFNKVGRGYNMDIYIAEDLYISKDTHCSIVYDAKDNLFYLIPAGGCLTYLNGNMLQETFLINSGDVIHIGESEFEFIAFCRGERSWKDKE